MSDCQAFCLPLSHVTTPAGHVLSGSPYSSISPCSSSISFHLWEVGRRTLAVSPGTYISPVFLCPTSFGFVITNKREGSALSLASYALRFHLSAPNHFGQYFCLYSSYVPSKANASLLTLRICAITSSSFPLPSSFFSLLIS